MNCGSFFFLLHFSEEKGSRPPIVLIIRFNYTVSVPEKANIGMPSGIKILPCGLRI